MKVIFIKDFKGHGKKDDIKEVKDGFAINYLIKNKYAVQYTDYGIKRLDNEHKEQEKKESELLNEYKKMKKEIEELTIKFKVKTGEKDKLFGIISSKQIADELDKLGYKIDKKKIEKSDLSTLGYHTVKIELHKKVILNLKIEIIKG